MLQFKEIGWVFRIYYNIHLLWQGTNTMYIYPVSPKLKSLGKQIRTWIDSTECHALLAPEYYLQNLQVPPIGAVRNKDDRRWTSLFEQLIQNPLPYSRHTGDNGL